MVDAVPSAWNLANMLTVLRIALVPFFAWALLADGGHSTCGRLIATAIFVLAAATDRMDGWLARRSGTVTDLGKLLDPIADKLLVGTALVLLSWLGDLPWWVTVVILVREIGITVHAVLPAALRGPARVPRRQAQDRAAVRRDRPVPPAARRAPAVGHRGSPSCSWPRPLVVTVVTGLDYVRAAVEIRRTASRPPYAGL